MVSVRSSLMTSQLKTATTTYDVEHFFHVILCHPYIFFGEVSV